MNWERLWERQPPLILRGLAWLYATGWRVYESLYRWGLKRRVQMPVPVVGVGSLLVGGAGKTPVAIAIARYLHEVGLRVVVLCSGYGGRRWREITLLEPNAQPDPREVGDEPVEILRALGQVPVAVGRRRVATARAALERWRPDVLVLDDGFQHLPLARTVDLLVLPAEHPFGNGYCLPAGPLREPRSGLNRADALLITRIAPSQEIALTHPDILSPHPPNPLLPQGEGEANLPIPPLLRGVSGEIGESHRPPSPPGRGTGGEGYPGVRGNLFEVTIMPEGLESLATGKVLPPDALSGQEVMAVSGIARAHRFVQTIAQLGMQVVDTHLFPDHYSFEREDWDWARGKTLVTTTKDAPKLRSRLPADCHAYALRIRARLEPAFSDWLLKRLQRGTGGTPVH